MAGNKETFQRYMNQGHTAAWDLDWEKAKEYYQSALNESPNHPQALSSLGLAFFELQDYLASLDIYQKAAKLSPEDPIPQEKIARIYEKLGKLNEAISASLLAAELHLKSRSAEKAIDNWIKVLVLQPEHVNVRMRLATVYEKLGRREEAIAEYIAVASILQRSGDLTRALKAIEYAQKMMPENQEVKLALSMLRNSRPLPRLNLHRSHGEGPRSLLGRETVAEKAKSSSDVHPDPINEAKQKALSKIAELLFDQVDETLSVSGNLKGKGIGAVTRGQTDQTRDSADRNRTVLHIGQAIESLTQGDDSQAIVEIEHALNLGLRLPAAYYLLGLLLKDQNVEKAIKYLQQAVKHPDFNLASHLIIAQQYEKTDRLSEASVSYLQALSLADASIVSPELSDDLLSQYDSLIDSQASVEDQKLLRETCQSISAQLNRPDWRQAMMQARQNLPSASDEMSPVPVAELVLEARNIKVVESMTEIRSLASRGKLRSALEDAYYILQFSPSYLPLHELIGDLLLQSGRTQEAVQKFFVITELYMVRGEVIRALRLLKRISKLLPSDVNLRRHLIDLLVSQEKIDEALHEYWNLADLFYHLAELDKARQTYLEALKIAQKAKESRKWGVDLLLKVADIDMQQLNLRQALRIYEQVRNMQPNHTVARAQIIGLNFRLGQETPAIQELDNYIRLQEIASHRQDAITFIKELLIDHPDRPSIRKRLADLYIQNGDIDSAVSQLDAVADSLLSENKNIEAVNMLETIISLNPTNVKEFRTALETLRREMLRK